MQRRDQDTFKHRGPHWPFGIQYIVVEWCAIKFWRQCCSHQTPPNWSKSKVFIVVCSETGPKSSKWFALRQVQSLLQSRTVPTAFHPSPQSPTTKDTLEYSKLPKYSCDHSRAQLVTVEVRPTGRSSKAAQPSVLPLFNPKTHLCCCLGPLVLPSPRLIMVGNFSALTIIMSGNDGAGHITLASQTGLSDSILGEHLHLHTTPSSAYGLWLVAGHSSLGPSGKATARAQILI